MKDRRGIIRFFAVLVVAYGVISFPWPVVTPIATRVFCEFGNTFLSHFGELGRVEFQPSPPSNKPRDLQIRLINVEAPRGGTMYSSSRLIGVLPLAQLWALILATPVPSGRRFRALVIGTLIVGVVIYFRLWVMVFYAFASGRPYSFYELGPFAQYLTEVGQRVLIRSMTFGFIFPVLIWVLVTLRREDVVAFVGGSVRTASDTSGSQGNTSAAVGNR